ncbi:hypothetical protein IFHNHDMJ_03041 [Synechococcus sp. CBW1107]|nr:hypothetical protein IFHNHDMJ_03041 [Synechococcus sp. CBW1107]
MNGAAQFETIEGQGIGVSSIWPARIGFRRRGLTCLDALLAAASPAEGCALLLGCRRETHWQVERVWPCLNGWQPMGERSRRFAIDPREQLLAQKWGRARALTVLGAAHSHPASAPLPSATDRRLAFPPALLVIAGPPGGDGDSRGSTRADLPRTGWALRCWWLTEEDTQPLPLAWTMVD